MKWHHIEKGHGTPLVLLHGIGMDSNAWIPVLDRLALQHRVIVFDLPGFGKTPEFTAPVLPTPHTMAAGLKQALLAMGIDQPVDLVGNSLGGFIALQAAAEGVARSVVGISPAGLWRDKAPLHIRPLFGSMRKAMQSFPGFSGLLMASGLARTALLAGPMTARGWKVPAHEAKASVHRFAHSPGFEAALDGFEHAFLDANKIKVPCTIAFGDLDWVFPLGTRDKKRAPRHAHWVRLPACGHVPMWDDPDRVAHVILRGIQAQ